MIGQQMYLLQCTIVKYVRPLYFFSYGTLEVKDLKMPKNLSTQHFIYFTGNGNIFHFKKVI